MYIYAGTLLDAASALSKEQDDTELMPTLKINWKSKKADSDNGGYNQELLEYFLQIWTTPSCSCIYKEKGQGVGLIPASI